MRFILRAEKLKAKEKEIDYKQNHLLEKEKDMN